MRAYLFLTITMILFAGNLLVGKAINDLPPITIAFFRCLVAFIVLLPFAWKQMKENKHLFKQEWKPLIFMSFTGVAFFTVLVYSALQFTSSTNASIVEATTPVFTIGVGMLVLKERLNLFQSLGMVLSLLGAMWVVTRGSWEVVTGLQFNIGDIIMVSAVILWAVYSVLVKQHNSKFPTYGGLAVMLGIAVLTLLPFAAMEWTIYSPNLLQVDKILGIIYLGTFPSLIGFILFNTAVGEVGPSQASIFFNLLPVFTMAGAALLLNEQIESAQLIGTCFVDRKSVV